MMEEQEFTTTTGSSTGTTIIAFLAGAAAGAGLALLFAPKTGQEMREKIRGATSDAMGRTKEYMSSMQGKAKEMMEQGKETFRSSSQSPGEQERTTH
jgi:gas vesicle protein